MLMPGRVGRAVAPRGRARTSPPRPRAAARPAWSVWRLGRRASAGAPGSRCPCGTCRRPLCASRPAGDTGAHVRLSSPRFVPGSAHAALIESTPPHFVPGSPHVTTCFEARPVPKCMRRWQPAVTTGGDTPPLLRSACWRARGYKFVYRRYKSDSNTNVRARARVCVRCALARRCGCSRTTVTIISSCAPSSRATVTSGSGDPEQRDAHCWRRYACASVATAPAAVRAVTYFSSMAAVGSSAEQGKTAARRGPRRRAGERH